MVPPYHIQLAHPLPSSYLVQLLLQDLDLRANLHFRHGKDQVISIQHPHLLLNTAHSQVRESDNLSLQISFMYMDPKGGPDAAVEPTVCNRKVPGSSPSLYTFVWVRFRA